MAQPSEVRPSGFGQWIKTHTYRTLTALLTLGFFVFAFIYHPEWVSWWLRIITHGIEQATAMLPYPYGDQVEVALKGLGGSFWLQITAAIVFLRAVLSSIAFAWRRQRKPRVERPRSADQRSIHDIVRRDY
ncbi:MAG: hypothetical protein K2X60_10655 [Xanthobacteraceae bacterium]|nr:hypothetical protein [Xanthobacteraceae bacterium]